MTGMDHVAIAAIVSVTSLVGLVLVLRFLRASLLAKSQADELRQWCMGKLDEQRLRWEKLAADCDNEKAKLTQLANRTR